MVFRSGYVVAVLLLAGAAAGAAWVAMASGLRSIDREDYAALYADPLPVRAPERVFHLGHSLVGRDMPAMLAQLGTHRYESQLGWGSPLRQHWEPDVPVLGFEEENDHPLYRDAHEAAGSGEYDALVVTEALRYRSRMPWEGAQAYLRKWATKAWGANPETRMYLYVTWDQVDAVDDWFGQIDHDIHAYWEGEMLLKTLAYWDVRQPIYVVPGGPAMAAVARAAEEGADLGPIKSRHDLFSDEIHFNDYGAYILALTHYAVLYGASPVGLPHALTKANGTPAADVGAEAARRIQDIVWDVVTSIPQTGVEG